MESLGGRQTASSGFNFTTAMRLLCADMVARVPQLGHIDLTRVAISFAQTRRDQPHGVQATLTPLRFEAGALFTSRAGRHYTLERLFDGSGREYLYILNFYLPRFLNHTLVEKLTTVVHELWHISPQFDGDVRRYSGRCYAHGPSQKQYDQHVKKLAMSWLKQAPPERLYSFLQHSFVELQQHFGQIYGVKVRSPKLVLASAKNKR